VQPTAPAEVGRKDTSGNILRHLIFSMQGRRPLIKEEFRDDLFAYLGGIIREVHATALIINGGNDHLHMLVRVRPPRVRVGMIGSLEISTSRNGS
jgi:putative transposase